MAKRKMDIRERALARAIDYKKVFASEQGKRVLNDLIRAHHVMTPTMVRGDETGLQMAYNEGQRNVVLRLLKMVNLSEADMRKLMGELDATE